MWLDQEVPIRKQEITLKKPLLNAPGTLGFYPNPHTMPFLPHMGAFVTNPISHHSRQPASNRNCIPFPGGFLLHTGLPNPGFNRTLAQNQHRWAGAPLPVIVHLLVESPQSLGEMIRRLESLENIMAVELGLPPDCQPETLGGLLDAARGELPIIVSLSGEQTPGLIQVLRENPLIPLHLTRPRGMLPTSHGEAVSGRLYGPAIFPLTLKTVKELRNEGLQVIASGGITQSWQARALLEIGAMGVGLGSVLWGVASESFFLDF